MPPERQRTPLGSGAPPAGVRTSHVDFLLRFLIAQSCVPDGGVADRLDSIEATIAALARQWRDEDARLAPARELRMCHETLEELLRWAEQAGPPDAAALPRLGVYASGAVTDRTVPDGWVRVHLDTNPR